MRPPNLLYLLTDEQRADTLAAYGNKRIEVPALNRLARESTIFERAYVTQPVCTPSRGSLLTGLYPHQHGCIENNSILDLRFPTLAERLPSGVYRCGYNGKWHLGDEVFAQRGFEDWVSTEDGYSSYFSEGRDRAMLSSYDHFLRECGKRPRTGRFFSRGEAARMEEVLGKPAFQASEACRFIRDHQNEPFALVVSFLEPHMPFFGPRDAQHPPNQVMLPINFDCGREYGHPLRTLLNRARTFALGHSGYPLCTEEDWRRMIARYWGLCSVIDAAVGRILGCLESCGLDDNTIVVLTSDHGDMMGSHRLIGKCLMYEEAVRVPLLIRQPGQRRGARIEAPVSHIDLLPTLLDLLGVQPVGMPGMSLKSKLFGDVGAVSSPVVIQWNGASNGILRHRHRGEAYPEWASMIANEGAAFRSLNDPVRTWIDRSGWKLTRSTCGQDELYCLSDDPGESVNRCSDPAASATFARLDRLLREWQEAQGDSVRFTD